MFSFLFGLNYWVLNIVNNQAACCLFVFSEILLYVIVYIHISHLKGNATDFFYKGQLTSHAEYLSSYEYSCVMYFVAVVTLWEM